MATKKSTRAAKAQSRPVTRATGARRTVKPAIDAKLLARIGAFNKSPAGVALAEAEQALEEGIALASVLLESLEMTPGGEHEATALRIAIEHLEKAANRLDEGSTAAAAGVASVPKAQDGTVVSLTAFPPERKIAVMKAIYDATGMKLVQVKHALETLPATFLALLSNSALASELAALGATATVVRS